MSKKGRPPLGLFTFSPLGTTSPCDPLPWKRSGKKEKDLFGVQKKPMAGSADMSMDGNNLSMVN